MSGKEPMPDGMAEATYAQQAAAVLRIRELERRARLRDDWDWYGLKCPCKLPLGECSLHPRARPSQRPPGSVGASVDNKDWRIWFLSAGRGFGKTLTAAQYIRHRIEKTDRHIRVGLVAETARDVRQVMIEGPTGLQAAFPPWWEVRYEPSKAQVTFWLDGKEKGRALLHSAEEPESLRGPQFHVVWVDELAKFKRNLETTWDNIEFCLRMKVYPHPLVVVTTTPRPRQLVVDLMKDQRSIVTGGSMFENASNLDPDFVERMRQKYENTRIGRQELFAELLMDTPGALWNMGIIEPHRLHQVPAHVSFRRVIVAIDPNAGSADPESGAESGIVVVAMAGDSRHKTGYVLADLTCKGSPAEWAKAALAAYQHWNADLIVAERNNGGKMVEAVIRGTEEDSAGRHPSGKLVPIKLVWASRGKATRAEPVSNLYEQGVIHHVGYFADLENQLCNYNPEVVAKDFKKDRMDALVWGLTEAMLGGGGRSGEVIAGGKRQTAKAL